MQQMAKKSGTMKPEGSQFSEIKTTLWELIEAVSEELSPAEDHWVPMIVGDMLGPGRSCRSAINYYPLFYPELFTGA